MLSIRKLKLSKLNLAFQILKKPAQAGFFVAVINSINTYHWTAKFNQPKYVIITCRAGNKPFAFLPKSSSNKES
ncbi:MAG: hypothetical protein ACI9AP_000807, partial [Flavobacteriales bacterium]